MSTKLIKKVVGTLIILLFASTILATQFNNGTKVYASATPSSDTSTSNSSYDYCLNNGPDIIGYEIVYIEVGTSININNPNEMGLLVFDCYYGNNITSKIKLENTGGFNANVIGTYYITYTVTDFYGDVWYFGQYVNVADSTKPVISGPNIKEIVVGSSIDIFDPKTMGLKVTDNYDGDITSEILLIDIGNYNSYVLGTYKLKYVAYDSQLNRSIPYELIVKVVNTKTVNHYHSNGKLKDKTVYNYNSKGKLTNETTTKYNSSGVVNDYDKYTYYSDGRKSSETHHTYYKNGTIQKKQVLNYYSNGKVKDKTDKTYDSKGIISSSHDYKYKSNGYSTNETIYNYYSNGNVKDKKVITYDSNGKKDYYTLEKYASNKKLLSKSKVYY